MIVLDCNAALEMAMGTQDGAGLKMLLLKGEKTYAPELFCYEVTHVLSKYVRGGYLSQEQAIRCGMRAFASVDEFVDDKGSWGKCRENRTGYSTRRTTCSISFLRDGWAPHCSRWIKSCKRVREQRCELRVP